MKRIFYTGFIFLFISCKKDVAPVPVDEDRCAKFQYTMTEDVSRANFKANSYWVLFDTISQAYDSIVVESNSTYNHDLPAGKHSDGCIPHDLRTKHGLKHYVYSSGSSVSIANNSDFHSLTASNKMIFLSSGSPCNFPYTICGTRIYHDYPTSATDPNVHYFRSEHDSLFVYNKYYNRCIKTAFSKNDSYDACPVKDKKEFVFNTEFGFIKFKRFDTLNNVTSCKVLVRHNILK